MRILLINVDYGDFLHQLYASTPTLANASYRDQLAARNATCFGTADFYSRHLTQEGFEAIDLHANNEALQRAWAQEHGISIPPPIRRRWKLRRGLLPWYAKCADSSWIHRILKAQVQYFQPDIIYNHAPDLGGALMRDLKPMCRLLVAQHAAPINNTDDFNGYDLVFSSLPNLVEWFRFQGINSEYLPLAFEPQILQTVRPACQRPIAVSFVGNLAEAHTSRVIWLREICQTIPVEIWGRQAQITATIQGACVHPPAWGKDMFSILGASRITLNHHIDMAQGYANNMRLFEATGMGALLITEAAKNLRELFISDQEVVTYQSPQECAEKIRYFLSHSEDCQRIAAAGQRRTLQEHTYSKRMHFLAERLTCALRNSGRRLH